MRTHHSRNHRGSPAVDRVVIAPHADDEALGCGGLLAKYHEDSAVVVLAKLDEARSREFGDAQEILGYPQAYLLDFPDGFVGDDMHSLVGLLDEVLNVCRPRELYLPFPSLHQDHVAAYEAGMRSARLSMTDGHWFPPSVLVYDVAAYDVSLYPSDLRWNVFESLDEEHIDLKVRASKAYSSQLVKGPHPVNGLKQFANALGAARQVAWAEQFALVRAVRGVELGAHDDIESRAAQPQEKHPTVPAQLRHTNGHRPTDVELVP